VGQNVVHNVRRWSDRRVSSSQRVVLVRACSSPRSSLPQNASPPPGCLPVSMEGIVTPGNVAQDRVGQVGQPAQQEGQRGRGETRWEICR